MMRSEIAGENITLRRLEKGFVALVYEAATESRGGEFTRWMPWCHENYSIEETRAFLDFSEEAWEKRKEYNFAIFENATGDFAGLVSLNQFNSQHNFFNLGYWIRVSKHNRGWASRAARLLARTAFEDLTVNRIEILAAIENVPSQRAAEKAGARREGVLRKRLLIGGRIHDAAVFSFTREDFAA